jgi:hypothetical protein
MDRPGPELYDFADQSSHSVYRRGPTVIGDHGGALLCAAPDRQAKLLQLVRLRLLMSAVGSNPEVSTYSDQVRFDAISRHGPDRLKISVRYPPLPLGSPIQSQKAVRVGFNNFLRFGPNLEKGELSAPRFVGPSGSTATAREADAESVAKKVLLRLAQESATWLLIYDNVASPQDIADLLPAAGAHILVTSRFSDWNEWADEVASDVLPRHEAATLLQNRAERSDDEGARSLADALGRLPLALDHAASTCRRSQMRFADYAVKLEKLIDAAPRGASYEVSLIKNDPFENGTRAITMHRLVQAATRVRLAENGTTERVVHQLARCLEHAFPARSANQPKLWPTCSALLPHALALRKYDTADRELLELRAKLFAAVADDEPNNFLQSRALLKLLGDWKGVPILECESPK